MTRFRTGVSVPPSALSGPAGLAESMLRPASGHHAFETCVGQLATVIRLGAFEHGSTLPPERELAERMSVSRATLREAMAALREAGMVTTARGRGGGTTVSYLPSTGPSGSSQGIAGREAALVDSLRFRRIVEPGACHLLAATGLPGAALAELVEWERAVRAAPDAASHRQADSRFHLAIAAGTGSRMLIDAITAVQADLHDMLCAIPVLEPNIVHSNRQHAAIVAAIVARDPTGARRAMEQHCDDTAALLAGLLGLSLLPNAATDPAAAPPGTEAPQGSGAPQPHRRTPQQPASHSPTSRSRTRTRS